MIFVISTIIFSLLVFYHFIIYKVLNLITSRVSRIEPVKRRRIFSILLFFLFWILIYVTYSYFENSANLGVGGVGFGNILVQCFYKSYQNQENYKKSGKHWSSLKEMLGDTAGFFSKDFPTDKASQHDYIPLYDKFLSEYRNKDVKLLEIGIKKGGSIKMWREFFNQNSIIYGLDIDPASPQFPKDTNIKSIIVDSRSRETQEIFQNGMMDIIIDDGVHTIVGQLQSFQNLLPKLKQDGIYVIEDVQRKDEFQNYFNDQSLEINLFDDKSGEYIAFIKRKK